MGLTDTLEAPCILPFLKSALGLSHLYFFLIQRVFIFGLILNICKIVQLSSPSNSKNFISPKRNSLAVTPHLPTRQPFAVMNQCSSFHAVCR